MSEAAVDTGGGSALRQRLGRFLRSPNAAIGAAIVLTVLAIAIAGPWLAPADYRKTDMLNVWEPPGVEFPLGADQLGRDILSRLLVGARVSLLVALSVLAAAILIGTTAGMIAAWRGGALDGAIMRVADMTLAFPEIIIAILVAAAAGPGITATVISLVVVSWPGIARLVRSLTLSLKQEPFVEAAIAAGTTAPRILIRHCLPNILPALIVRASVGFGFIVMAEATLSFLGLGVQEPVPSWGGMIRDGLTALTTDPHLALAASAALGLTIVGFNLLGDGLRDLLDPRTASR